MPDQKRRLSDFEKKSIVKRHVIGGETMVSIGRSMDLSPLAVSRLLSREETRHEIEKAQNELIKLLPNATKAFSELVKDYSDKDTRSFMGKEVKSHAYNAIVKVLEAPGLLTSQQSPRITNIFNNNQTTISPNVLNIINNVTDKQLEECGEHEEVNFEEIK